MSVANQKIALIDRTEVPKTNFFMIAHETFFMAARRLTLNGLRVYMYFMAQVPDTINNIKNEKNKRPSFFEISSSRIAEVIGMDTKTAQRGIDELIKKGYLILRQGNLYQFIDILLEDKAQTIEEHEQVMNYADMLNANINKMNAERNQQLKDMAESIIPDKKYSWQD